MRKISQKLALRCRLTEEIGFEEFDTIKQAVIETVQDLALATELLRRLYYEERLTSADRKQIRRLMDTWAE